MSDPRQYEKIRLATPECPLGAGHLFAVRHGYDYYGRVVDVELRFEYRVPIKPRGRSLQQQLTREHLEGIESMKRFNQDGQKKQGKWVPSGDKFLKDRPFVDALLTDAWWDDGKPRDVCSLTVRVGTRSASVSVNDAENEASITTQGESVEDALDRLEAYLAAGNPTWRQWGKKRR